MAVTAQPYGQFLADVTKGVHSLGTDTDYIALLSSSYTPNISTHTSFADLTNEVTGTGYTAGGAAASLTPATYTGGSTNSATVAAADVSWASVTVTFRYAVLYKRVGSTASANPLVGLFDFGTDRVYTASPLKLTFPTGIMTLAKV